MPSDPPGDPPSGDGSEPVTPAALRAYLGASDVLSHLRAMLMRRVPRQVVEDVLNDAVVKMCATAALPRELALGGWVETSTLSAVTDHLRKKGRRSQETATGDIDDRADSDPPSEDRLEWLRKRVQKSRIDAETLAMFETQAREGLTRAQLAERYEMTEDALKKRFQRFRAKYEEAWKRERTLMVLLVLFVAAVLAVTAWLVVPLLRRPPPTLPIGPEPLPSVSAAPAPLPVENNRRNIAAPPDAGEVVPGPKR